MSPLTSIHFSLQSSTTEFLLVKTELESSLIELKSLVSFYS